MKKPPPLYHFGVRFPKITIGVCLFATIFAFLGSKQLKVINNLTDLLPSSFESVRALNDLKKYFGGQGFLLLAVQGQDPPQTEQFADEFVRRIEGLPEIRYVEYRRPVEFFKKRQWLYLDREDLTEMSRRLDRSLELEKKGYSPTFNHLMDFADEEDRPDLTFSDILKKYEDQYGIGKEGNQAYPSSDEGKFIVLKVKTSADPHDMDLSQKIVGEIQQIEGDLKRSPLFSSMTVGYTGDSLQSSEQVEYISRKMAWVSGIVTLLLLIILFVYFRNLNGAFLVGIPLLIGIFWTGGIIYLLFGHLNILTGFAAGILAGLGSDYGIYLLTRYYQERETGIDFSTACRLAFTNTGRATYGSMITTVFAFLALLFSDFGVSREFGAVGAVGIFMNYVAMMLVIPALLALGEKRRVRKGLVLVSPSGIWTHRTRFVASPAFKTFFSPKGALFGVVLALVLCLFSAFSLPSQSVMHFEDGRMDPMHLKGQELYDKTVNLLGGGMQPTILIVEGESEDQKTVATFDSLRKQDSSPEKRFLKNVLGLSTFIPQEIEAKKELLVQIIERFKKSSFPIKSKREQLIASLQDSLAAPPIKASDLPIEVKRKFESPLQKDLSAVYLFPTFDDHNWDETKQYTDLVKNVRKAHDLHFRPVDNYFISTEFVSMMEKDGPQMIFTTLLFLFGVLLWMIRPLKRAVITFAHLVGGLLLLSGLQWLFKIPLNTINIAAFPIILGTGIDSFIHFGLRFDETGDIEDTIQNKLASVLVSNLTTIVGFGGLLFTPSAGLRSLGAVAVLGLTVMTLLCAFVFPRCLVLETRRKVSALKFKEEILEA